MKTKPIIKTLILFLFIATTSQTQVQAQSEAQASTTLELQNQFNRGETIAISPNDKVKVQTQNGKKRKGAITSVRDSSFFVGENEIAFSAVEKITISKDIKTGIASKLALLYGLINALAAVLFYFLGYWAIRSTNDQGSFIGVLIGLFFWGLAAIVGITALVFLSLALIVYVVGKASAVSYLIGRKWRLRKRVKP